MSLKDELKAISLNDKLVIIGIFSLVFLVPVAIKYDLQQVADCNDRLKVVFGLNKTLKIDMIHANYSSFNKTQILKDLCNCFDESQRPKNET